MATGVIAAIVFILFALAVKSMIRQKKQGSCGCGCENCSLQCHNNK